jgi:hypothetical protein
VELPNPAGEDTLKIDKMDKIVEKLREVPGDVAEFGCYEGENTEHMARAFGTRTVWAWDTFEGMPDDSYIEELDNSDPPGKWVPGKSPLPHFEHLNKDHGMNIHPVVGVFSKTIPAFEHPEVRFAFVHIDCDHYHAYRRVLEFITPRMSPGGMVRLDDYGCCAGAKKATDEWLATTGHKLIEDFIYF